ncbi:hypothetical protein BDY19DRAFT_393695 [Irpex rosettiformis]|uniref:Uncharacterized protein n=1 Tax=Irpex rosettiformis TaxID=378272 RepID=A0ACB8TV97_9APHY|nr:hypothetical protein BDY19DRAFT_393695 [Irpex rosettiformis]
MISSSLKLTAAVTLAGLTLVSQLRQGASCSAHAIAQRAHAFASHESRREDPRNMPAVPRKCGWDATHQRRTTDPFTARFPLNAAA